MLKIGRYKHYKGKEYEVIGVAHHSETFEELVVYRALFNSPKFGKNALWVRPLKMFAEEIEIDGNPVKPNGHGARKVPRFKYIGK